MADVKVPVLGESITEATVGEWLKNPGDPVKLDEPIASLETDKVSVEVPSPVAGVMGEHLAKVGDTVEVGAVIATIAEGGAAAAPAPAASPAPAPAPAPTAPAAVASYGSSSPTQGQAPGSDGAAALSPSVRRAVL